MPSCNEPCRAKWLVVADNLLVGPRATVSLGTLTSQWK
jgi:hypothetical protein